MLQEWLDVKIVGCEDYLKEHLLINGHKLLVPLADSCGASLLRVRMVVPVVFTVDKYLNIITSSQA